LTVKKKSDFFIDFGNQLKIADMLLKAYQYRYEKLKGKFSNVNDILSTNYEFQKTLFTKLEKLDSIEAKLTKVEVKLNLLGKRIDSVDERLEKKKKGESGVTDTVTKDEDINALKDIHNHYSNNDKK
jgi:hypothetical protein